jgi:hypothetical protein
MKNRFTIQGQTPAGYIEQMFFAGWSKYKFDNKKNYFNKKINNGSIDFNFFDLDEFNLYDLKKKITSFSPTDIIDLKITRFNPTGEVLCIWQIRSAILKSFVQNQLNFSQLTNGKNIYDFSFSLICKDFVYMDKF